MRGVPNQDENNSSPPLRNGGREEDMNPQWEGNINNNNNNNNNVNGNAEYYDDEEEETGEEEEFEEEEELEESVSGSESGSSVVTWVSWYCSRPGYEYFTEVPDDFISDEFNLTGLQNVMPYYNEALDLILDLELEEQVSPPIMTMYETAAEYLYSLIHARYILTKQGMAAMAEKFEAGVFGTCPRVYCGGAGVLPVGLTDSLHVDSVKLCCGLCGDIYVPKDPKHQSIDGACFGPTFANLFWLTYPEYIPLLHPPKNHPTTTRPRRKQKLLPPTAEPNSNSNSDTSNSDTDDDDEDDEDEIPGDVRGLPELGAEEEEEEEDDELDEEVYRIYTPKIFGFRINERSRVASRMKWLRWKEGMDVRAVR
ncbi:casein kinase II, regulatory subunit [Fimicolochytrium jonesii]|uniref:casein kinase II, regulatory subunit n=1 Tax=Fimicolochytrium jonesii TaxID=1396493 RepID=UPI0022FE3D66|nr:casein kinase II, regulatory subunit [Fimicolochytrium jonesii]KAI8816798.1 casein kinase II, regulatory subunit [Fimicolochytrium jonesii]